MSVNPGYIDIQFPGQPAPKTNPMEGAFKLLAGFMAGKAEMQKAQDSHKYDLLKQGVEAGLLNVGADGSVSAVPLADQFKRNYYNSQIEESKAKANLANAQANYWNNPGGVPGAGGSGAGKRSYADLLSDTALLGDLKKLPRKEGKRALEAMGVHGNEIDAMLDQLYGPDASISIYSNRELAPWNTMA